MLRISTLALAGFAAATATSVPEKRMSLSEVVSFLAPEEWQHLQHYPVSAKKEHTTRNLKGPRLTFKNPANTEEGYLTINLYENADCNDASQAVSWGFRAGTCFAAVDHSSSPTVVGSWKVGIVVHSSGREHNHVERYTSSDCTGTVHRGSSQLARIHYFDGEPHVTLTDKRSRHFFHEQAECYKLKYYSGSTPPIDDQCIDNMSISAHLTDGSLSDCDSDPWLLYSIYPNGDGSSCDTQAATVCVAYDYVAALAAAGNTDQKPLNPDYDAWGNMIFHKDAGVNLAGSATRYATSCRNGHICPALDTSTDDTGTDDTGTDDAATATNDCEVPGTCFLFMGAACTSETCVCMGASCVCNTANGSCDSTASTTCSGSNCGCSGPACVMVGAVLADQATQDAGDYGCTSPGNCRCTGSTCHGDPAVGVDGAAYCGGPDCGCLTAGDCNLNEAPCSGAGCSCPDHQCVTMGPAACVGTQCGCWGPDCVV